LPPRIRRHTQHIPSRLMRLLGQAINPIKVQFLVAGTQKGGTSALHVYMKKHPQICTAVLKEVHFFDNNWLFSWRISRQLLYRYYHSFFNPKNHHRIVGECTPSYMYRKECPQRIREYNPQMKFILLLRNPIDRAFSHWNMHREQGTESASFWDAIHRQQAHRQQALPNQAGTLSYLDRGFYTEQLTRLWRCFPQTNTLVLKSEHLRDNPNDVLDRIANFLELDPFPRVELITVHARHYVSQMAARERDYLREIFENEIRGLEQMLNWDCTDWLSDKPKENQQCERAA
jgi:sulfotransferase family protein